MNNLRHEQKLHTISILSSVIVVIAAFFAFGLGNSLLEKLDFTTHESVTQQVTVETIPDSPKKESLVPTKKSASTYMTKQVAKPEPTLDELEKKTYVFDGSGEIFQVASQKKPATISMVLKPLPGTLLKQFEIVSGKLTMDKYGIPIERGIVTFLEDHTINLEFLDGGMSPTGTMVGTSDELPINDVDDKVEISFTRQQLFLSNNDSIPYYLSILGTLQ